MFARTDYDYDLPEDRIALAPVTPRDQSRLLCLDRKTKALAHCRFHQLDTWLAAGDLLIVNDTRVVPARLKGKKSSGGRVEGLLLDYPGQASGKGIVCRCLLKSSKQLQPGTNLVFEDTLPARVIDFNAGEYGLYFETADLAATLAEIGRVPLPPYIEKRRPDNYPYDDRQAYQTIYADEGRAVAAPTAGLHFTAELMQRLQDRGVRIAPLTLHVGHGTFLPVRTADIREHRLHAESFQVSRKTADLINRTKADGGRVVAVGTTVVRVLEYLATTAPGLTAAAGECDLFIYPGFSFRVVDALITNFHLPQSTLLMLVSAFAGRESVLAAYRTAIAENYRFYSYGDAMLIC